MLTEQQKEHLTNIVITATLCLREQNMTSGNAYFLRDIGEKLNSSARPPRAPVFDAELMKAQEVVA